MSRPGSAKASKSKPETQSSQAKGFKHDIFGGDGTAPSPLSTFDSVFSRDDIYSTADRPGLSITPSRTGFSIRNLFGRSPTHPSIESQAIDDPDEELTTVSVAGPLFRVERAQLGHTNGLQDMLADEPEDKKGLKPWNAYVRMITCCIPAIALKRIGGMSEPQVQQAWREKVALVSISLFSMAIVGFMILELQSLACFTVRDPGWITWEMIQDSYFGPNADYTHPSTGESTAFVYDGQVYSLLNLSTSESIPAHVAELAEKVVTPYIGRDATMLLYDYPEIIHSMPEAIGIVKGETSSCILARALMMTSLLIVISLISIKFVLAVYFEWIVSRKLGKMRETRMEMLRRKREEALVKELTNIKELAAVKGSAPKDYVIKTHALPESEYTDESYTVMLVTCYSENQEGIKTTLDSLASTVYDDSKKLIVIIADGDITGSGNTKSTPELVLELLDVEESFDVEPQSYNAVADGSKRHNMARVYAAQYHCDGHVVPTIFISKCGTPKESTGAKPGNRGKRDSQVILMSFFEKVTLDDPMSPLEYDMFRKILYLSGVTPDRYEIVLMVDADTRVEPDSLARLVAVMVHDPLVMGLCGETRIMNKSESWVSRIQVFEYYLSHHLSKTFESVFGCVTCLPGCFCMWRIKARKPGGLWVPILCNPDIIEAYSQTVVNSLHQKNLLLLGEDRFLTTIMLRTFPRRKTMFVPAAFCKTTVPTEFKILLSQRRRWINSTIHNLMELVLIKELCGVFCFSMNFLILIELVGTATLPASMLLTFHLVIQTGLNYPDVEVGPLALVGTILGFPLLLILLTTRRLSYIYWYFVYMASLPIATFVLPLYAYWHFDDFSWGKTRKVEGEEKGQGHGDSDGKSAESVPLKLWSEWVFDEVKRNDGTESPDTRAYTPLGDGKTGVTYQKSRLNQQVSFEDDDAEEAKSFESDHAEGEKSFEKDHAEGEESFEKDHSEEAKSFEKDHSEETLALKTLGKQTLLHAGKGQYDTRENRKVADMTIDIEMAEEAYSASVQVRQSPTKASKRRASPVKGRIDDFE